MTETELRHLRDEHWNIAGNRLRTIEEAQGFLDRNGICSVYPVQSLLLPSWAGAVAGSAEKLSSSAGPASSLPGRDWYSILVHGKKMFEVTLSDGALIVSAGIFPFVYALAGPKNPKCAPDPDATSVLVRDLFIALSERGEMNKEEIARTLAGGLSEWALDGALQGLVRDLRVVRLEDSEGRITWDILYRWAPQAIQEGLRISAAQAMSALISQYLRCTIAVEQKRIEQFMHRFVAISRVREVLRALESGREVEHASVGEGPLLRLAGEPWPETSSDPRDSGRIQA